MIGSGEEECLMIDVDLDFETRSRKDLSKCGSLPYLWDKKADIVCLGYKIEEEKTQLWIPGMPTPEFLKYLPECNLYAFNSQFDMRVWHILGSRKYGWMKTKLKQWTDIMAICGRFTYHQSLKQAGEDLGLKQLKFETGTALMKRICMPPFEYTSKELSDFYDYCIRDVDSMHEMKKALPASKLNASEQKIWELTVKINMRGLPVDLEAVKQILEVTSVYREEQNQLLPSLTDNLIDKATQTQRITKWVRSKGIVLKNLQADTVTKILKKTNLPDDVRTVLELRQELGKSSVAKYTKIMDLIFHGRVHDNVRYYGANTGRWTGLGFQLLNLPRSKVNKEAEELIQSFFNLTVIEKNPIQTAKSLVRQMVKAPDGKLLQFGDYASIEYVFLIWVTNDKVALDRFAAGFDQYKDMAMERYGVAYEDVNDDQRYRGKQLILGCGYGLGWKGFVDYCEQYDVYITDEEAQESVNAYRRKYKRVVRFWYNCKDAALNAVTYPGHTFKVKDARNVKYKCIKDRNKTRWLQCTLPSGRNIYYNDPTIGEGKFGPEIKAMGINPYTKKWMRMSVIPGRLAENISQATCRDILVEGKMNLDKAGYKIIGSIYDEIICEVDENNVNQKEFERLSCQMPAWAEGLPVKMESVAEKRYRKL